MKDKRVGVFMQLYRNEASMHRAIESVLGQTYENLKFYILVSNATKTDVMRYAEKDARIEVIDGKPGESSYNYDKYIAGDSNAYFTVIDADDWYEKQYIEELVAFAEEYHTDIVACGNCFVDEQERQIGLRQCPRMLWDAEKTVEVLPYMYSFFRTIWGKLMTSEVILGYDPNGLQESSENGGYGGDTIFMFNLFQSGMKLGICDKVLYNYRVSSTSGSYVLREGRLESDVLLFRYVKDLLCRFGDWGEMPERFLYQVYGEAMKDTVSLIIKQKCLEEKKAEMLLYIFKKDETATFLDRDRRELLSISCSPVKRKYVDVLYEMIFFDLNKCAVTPKTVIAYLELFEMLFIKWKGALSPEEFSIILKNREMLKALIEENFQELFECLISTLKKIKVGETKTCMQLLRRVTANALLKPLLQEKKMALVYADLLLYVNRGKNENAFIWLNEFFQNEKVPYQAEVLVEFWINLAASLENANEFISGKENKALILLRKGKTENAKQEYEDLKELGVSDEYMDWLRGRLYGEEIG